MKINKKTYAFYLRILQNIQLRSTYPYITLLQYDDIFMRNRECHKRWHKMIIFHFTLARVHNLIRMNKFKAKVNAWQQFSPWQDSFRDLYKTLQTSKRRQAQQKLFTMSPNKQSLDLSSKQSSKHQLNRTLLNMSKINLHNEHEHMPEPVVSESRRYLGPRITFYAKMNPRVNRSKSELQIDEQLFKQTQIFKKQFTGKLVKDDSIKYLEIIDEDSPAVAKHGQGQNYVLPKSNNNHLLERVQSKKNQQQHAYLRRLKVIYNSRRH